MARALTVILVAECFERPHEVPKDVGMIPWRPGSNVRAARDTRGVRVPIRISHSRIERWIDAQL